MPRFTLVAALAIIVVTAHPVHQTGSVSVSVNPADTMTAAGSVELDHPELAAVSSRAAAEPPRLSAAVFPVDLAPVSRITQQAGLSTFARDLATVAVRLLRVPTVAEAVAAPLSATIPAAPLAPSMNASAPSGVDLLLEEAASATYIDELVRARRSFLTRWNAESNVKVRVWISDIPDTASGGLDSATYSSVVRQAWLNWTEAGAPLNVEFVDREVDANVTVSWTESFEQPISGRTRWSHDTSGWILGGEITLALRYPGGRPLDERALGAIMMHEIGHVIGLDHVSDPSSIMAPMVRSRELGERDRATVQLLYRLPAGAIHQ